MKQNNNIPQGYKGSPLGIIPQEWVVKRLADVSEITSGATPLRSNERYFLEGNIPWVKTTDLNNGFLTHTEEFITPLALQETSVKMIPKGSILVAMYGGFNQIGRTALLSIDATINQALSALILKGNDVSNIFLLNWLNSEVKRWKKYAASSRKDPNITSKDVQLFFMPLPPLAEQQKIVEILTCWDTAIEKQIQLIEKLETRKRGLMQQLLTGKKRLKGFEKKVLFKQLKPFVKELSVRNNKSINTVLSVTNQKGFIEQREQFDRIVASENLSNYKIVQRGQFAYNPSRVNVGSLDLLKTFDIGVLSPMYIVFETDETKLSSNFLYYQLKTFWFTGHIPMFVQGSVRDSLSFDGLCAMKFFVPSIPEQTAIANILSATDNELAKEKEKLTALKSQKKGLMQQLLMGKKRVKVNE